MAEDEAALQRRARGLVGAWARTVCAGAAPQLAAADPSVALGPDVPDALARVVEKRVRVVLAEAQKRRAFRKGDALTADDFNGALESLGEGRSLGHPKRPSSDRTAARVPLAPREVRLADVAARAAERNVLNVLPEPSLAVSWLAVDGARVAPEEAAAGAPAEPGLRPEQEAYFKAVAAAVDGAADDAERREVFRSLREDAGLTPLTPRLASYFGDEAARAAKRPLRALRHVVAAVGALSKNPRAGVERHLHRLVPAALTLIVAKRLGPDPDGDHWDLRAAAARVVARICYEFGDRYADLQPRVAQTLTGAVRDAKRPPQTKYGALVGLAALGPRAVAASLAPDLAPLVELANGLAVVTAGASAGDRVAARHVLDAVARCVCAHARNGLLPGGRPPSPLGAFPRATEAGRPPKRLAAPKASKKPAAKRKRGDDDEAPAVAAAPRPQPPRGGPFELLDLIGEPLLPWLGGGAADVFI